MMKDWNEYVVHHGGSLLQSWQWGEIQEMMGRKIWRLNEDNLKVLIVGHDLPFKKNYLYSPRAFVASSMVDFFVDQIKEIGKKEGSVFFKLELDQCDPKKSFLEHGFSLSDKFIQPPRVAVLDIRPSEDELLSEMHSKTRYNIRLAQKKGVVVKEVPCNCESLKTFLDLSRKTAKRDGFSLHCDEYYDCVLNHLIGAGMGKLFFAECDNRVAAGLFAAFFGETAYYLYGASEYSLRSYMAPFLIQWHVIKLAKEMGFSFYDFGGSGETDWAGISRFKAGFGSGQIEYPSTLDLVFKPFWYKAYKTARRVKKLI